MPQPNAVPTHGIRDWSKHFEKAQSRACTTTKWVAVPNKFDGISYRRLMGMERGLEFYGAWVLLLLLASKQPSRGVLARDGEPLTAEDMALATGAPQASFEAAIPALVAVGWLETISAPSADYQRTDSAPSADCEHAEGSLELQDSTSQDRIFTGKENRSKATTCSPAANENFENQDSEKSKPADQEDSESADSDLPWDEGELEDETPPAPRQQDHAAATGQLEALYKTYPRKGHRRAALRAAGVALSRPGAPSYAELLEAVREYARAFDALDHEQQRAIPLFSSWLRDGQWLDDRREWQPDRAPRVRA